MLYRSMFWFGTEFSWYYKSLLTDDYVHADDLQTGTTDTLLEISTPAAEEFGWTMFAVVVMKQIFNYVHATRGDITTVFTLRMSL